jgi:hypothetical protein
MFMVQFRLIASLVLIIAFLPRLPLNQGDWTAVLFAYAWLGLGVLIFLANGQQMLRMRKQRKIFQMEQRRKRLAAQKKLVRSV